MKRFFCRICKSVKRVNRLPASVIDFSQDISPDLRVGECRWHVAKNQKVSHREFLNHKPGYRAPVVKRTSAPTPPKKSSRKPRRSTESFDNVA